MATKPSVAAEILYALKAAGAEIVFGLPGVHNLAFWREPPGSRTPRLVNVRHEQTVVYAADGWSRASGSLGAGLVTTGPGAANTLGAFGEASRSGSPVVLIASEVPLSVTNAGMRSALHQSKDQAGMFEGLAKAVFTPRSAAEVARDVGLAIAAALRAPRGPVYVDVPADLLGEAGAPVQLLELAAPELDAAALGRAAALVEKARTVVLWGGGGVVDANAAGELVALGAHLQAPVVTTFSARGAIPCSDASYIGLPPHEPEVEELLAGADLLLGFGSDFDAMMTKNATLRLPPVVIDVNVDPEVMQIGYPGVVEVHGDAKLALQALLATTKPRDQGLVEALPGRKERVWARIRNDVRTAEACAFVGSVERAALGRAVLVNDMTIPGYWLGNYYGAVGCRTMQYPVGWGTLGYALPASVGAAYGCGQRVLAVCGDGGFMYGIGELATLVQEHLPVTVLVVDDAGYGMLRFDQQHSGDEFRGVDLVTPDFVALAASFGIPAALVESVGAPLEAALTSALRSDGPQMVVLHAALYPPRTTSPRWREALVAEPAAPMA